MLHDTVEDTDTSFKEILENFGEEVEGLFLEQHHVKKCIGGQIEAYRIRPTYRTVRLGLSKALGNLVVKYSPNKGTL